MTSSIAYSFLGRNSCLAPNSFFSREKIAQSHKNNHKHPKRTTRTPVRQNMSSMPKRIQISSAVSLCQAKAEALAALQHDGAVILTHIVGTAEGSWDVAASRLPFLLFESNQLLSQHHIAAGVHLEHASLNLEGKALLPHTDGYVWGDKYPDLVILLCECPSEEGGDNYLIDGERVMARLDPETANVLKEIPVDHTERSDMGIANGAESVVPVWRWCNYDKKQCWWDNSISKRMCWRRMIRMDVIEGRASPEGKISLWNPVSDDNDGIVDNALTKLDEAIMEEQLIAPRFQLKEGEALIVDNFRMLHSREEYSTHIERRMWRVWTWTNGSMGLPPEDNGEGVPGTVLEASNAIRDLQLGR